MTEKELEKLIKEKYGAFPDGVGVMAKEHFDSRDDWNEYCRKTIDMLNLNAPKAKFFDFFSAPYLWCNVPLPPD